MPLLRVRAPVQASARNCLARQGRRAAIPACPRARPASGVARSAAPRAAARLPASRAVPTAVASPALTQPAASRREWTQGRGCTPRNDTPRRCAQAEHEAQGRPSHRALRTAPSRSSCCRARLAVVASGDVQGGGAAGVGRPRSPSGRRPHRESVIRRTKRLGVTSAVRSGPLACVTFELGSSPCAHAVDTQEIRSAGPAAQGTLPRALTASFAGCHSTGTRARVSFSSVLRQRAQAGRRYSPLSVDAAAGDRLFVRLFAARGLLRGRSVRALGLGRSHSRGHRATHEPPGHR